MIRFNSYKNFKDIKNKNKISITYAIENNSKTSKIENLIDIILAKKNSFVFESVEKAIYRGRYTIFGYDSDKTYEIKNNQVFVNNKRIANKDPYLYLKKLVKTFNYTLPKNLPPMSLMLIGYFGYDIIRFVEKIPNRTKNDLKIPDVRLQRPRKIIIHDNLKKKLFYITCSYSSKKNSKNLFNKCKIDLNRLITESNTRPKKITDSKKTINLKIKSNTSKKIFLNNVKIAKKYIKVGDIFQVVLSQRFEAKLQKNPIDIYKKIRKTNPSPFLYFINYNDFQIIGSSPEILVRVKDSKITIRPIAGTRPRGKTINEDNKLKKDLLSDPKELAEHLMLLDLGRNDVGKFSETGTVKVDSQFSVEKYSHVMHIVSNVTGQFKTGTSLIDALLSGFPAGTVSGAPKIRAMEIIDELEKTRRKLYAGGIGYFSPNNTMDTCIALRTALIKNKKVYIQSGAGIVADSDPEKEYQETVNKAKALIEAIR